MWQHQKKRVCAAHPALEEVFKQCAPKSAKNAKKRRKVGGFPRTGIWYTFKRWLSGVVNYKEARRIWNEGRIGEIVVGEAIRCHIPYGDKICKFTCYVEDD